MMDESSWRVALIAVVVACSMEAWATILHRLFWHGALWPWHRSHHRGRGDVAASEASPNGWQHNDLFGLLHALIAIAFIIYGFQTKWLLGHQMALGAGWGMTAFGVGYVTVHDGLSHGRLPVRWLRRWRFLWRIAAAHQCHHRTGGPPFGLFLGPWVLRRMAAQRRDKMRNIDTTKG